MDEIDELTRRFFADESKVVPKHDIMNDFNLLKAFLSVELIRRPMGHGYNRPSEHWQLLFNYYNEASGDKHLGMSCQSCYEKVYSFVKNYLLQKCLAATRP